MKKICILFLLIISLSTQADLKLLNYELGQEFSNSSDSFFKYSNNFFSLDANPNFMINISTSNNNLITNIKLQSKDIFQDKNSCNSKLNEFFNISKNNYLFYSENDGVFYLSNDQSINSFIDFHTKLENHLKSLYEDFNNQHPTSELVDEDKSELYNAELFKKINNLYDIFYSTYQNSYIEMSCKKTSNDSNYFYNEIFAQAEGQHIFDTDNISLPKIDFLYVVDGIVIGNKLPSEFNKLNNNKGSFEYKNFVINTEKNEAGDYIVVAAYLNSSQNKMNHSIKKCFDFINKYTAYNIDFQNHVRKMEQYKPSFYLNISNKKSLNIHISCNKDELYFSSYTNKNIQSEDENE